MKQLVFIIAFAFTGLSYAQAQTTGQQLYMDVHYLPAGKVKFEDVAAAHKKDLAAQKKYGVSFIKYWVDENKGIVYCLSTASDSNKIREVHREAHGLLPHKIMAVSSGVEAASQKGKPYFLDVHTLGAGKVTAKDVAAAHEKDLAVQKKYGVNCINYWVNEKGGIIFCLAQASDASKVIETHRHSHGLIPGYIAQVKQGQ